MRMNGFIGKSLAAACVAASLAGAGCCGYYDMVDPCYPQRYNFTARTEVCGALTPQVKDGHILDQTIWNWMFKYDPADPSKADQLNPAGMEKLNELVRRRPVPDPVIYLATSQVGSDPSLTYDPDHPEALVERRHDLDTRRIVAVQKYLNAQTADCGIAFQVVVHNPTEPDLPAAGIAGAIRTYYAAWGGAAGGGAAAPAAPR
jgi:hypothetical protein